MHNPEDILAQRIAAIIPAEVDDATMECGGRSSLDRHLSGREKLKEELGVRCGSCAASGACLIGQARGH